MRPTITATILAIAASLAAGHDHPSSKSSKSASACNSCSLDAIGRAQEMTNLAYGMFAPEGVITQAALVAFCADEDRQQTYLEAANDIGGCLVKTPLASLRMCLHSSLLVVALKLSLRVTSWPLRFLSFARQRRLACNSQLEGVPM